MDDFTLEEIRYLQFLVRGRLRYESRRTSHPIPGGRDMQAHKTFVLAAILDKLERMEQGDTDQ